MTEPASAEIADIYAVSMIRRPSAGGAAATAPGGGLITGFPAQPSHRLVMGCTAAQACEGAPICGRRLPRSPNRRRRTGSAAKQNQAKPSTAK